MKNLDLYRIEEEYAKYMHEKENKVMKAFENKKTRPFIRDNIRNK